MTKECRSINPGKFSSWRTLDVGHRATKPPEGTQNYSLGLYSVLSTLPRLTRNLLSHLVPCNGPACRGQKEGKARKVSFPTLWLMKVHTGLEDLVGALVVLGLVAQWLELVYVIMAWYMEELEQKLEELIER